MAASLPVFIRSCCHWLNLDPIRGVGYLRSIFSRADSCFQLIRLFSSGSPGTCHRNLKRNSFIIFLKEFLSCQHSCDNLSVTYVDSLMGEQHGSPAESLPDSRHGTFCVGDCLRAVQIQGQRAVLGARGLSVGREHTTTQRFHFRGDLKKASAA